MRDKLKRGWNKFWKILWHDNTPLSWVLNIALAYLLIQFVLYPVAGFALGTDLPVVAVVSSSMDHRATNGIMCGERANGRDWWDVCGPWYEERGFVEEDFQSYPFKNGFWKGDIMVLWRFTAEKAEVGDVIVFQAQKQYPIIHRIVNITDTDTGRIFATKGDHNPQQIQEYALSNGVYLHRCYQTVQGTTQASLCGPGVERVGPGTPNAIELLDETRITESEVIGKAVGRVPLLGWIKIWATDLLFFISGAEQQAFIS